MRVSDLTPRTLAQQLKRAGIRLQIGPVAVYLRSSIPSLATSIGLLYAEYPLLDDAGFTDFYIRLASPISLRRWIRPQVLFMLDGRIPFKPLPLDHAFPFFEWGLNWCIAKYLNQYLILHGAVVEQGGCAVIVPGPPGSGKSTLCAALVNHGWRLLSDELALIRPMDRRLVPVPRPISLKNESIEVIRAFAPAAVIGPAAHDTAKGTVAHMRPPSESIARSGETASPAWIIFPRYQRGQRAVLTPRPKAGAFMEIAENAFNYNVLGVAGFRTLTQVVDECSCYDLTYGELGDALTVLSGLALRESWIEAEGYARTP